MTSARRRLFAPEVVQSSAMDCGPAALKCLLDGFGIPASYGRLREACQTNVDGTSIDMLEDVAVQLGLDAEQTMLSVDQLLAPEANALPALLVTVQPDGGTHFVVVWSSVGPLLQVMDPATGRRWVGKSRFLDEVYIHEHRVPAAEWREWAGGKEFAALLGRGLTDIGVGADDAQVLIERASADPSWRALAALDATARMLRPIADSGALPRGAGRAVVESILTHAGRDGTSVLPDDSWAVRDDDGAEGSLRLRGAVLVKVRGRADGAAAARDAPPRPLSDELVESLREPPPRPGIELLRMLRHDGLLAPALLTLALAAAAGGVIVEALLLRGLIDVGRDLNLAWQRVAAVAVVIVFALAVTALEWRIAASLFRLGRGLEARFRIALCEKLPRLADRYFASRLTADMAERGHMIHGLREIPPLGGRLVRRTLELVLTTAGIAWLDPSSAPFAFAAAGATVTIAALASPALTERDLKVRSHVGALSRFYLDALLGLVPIRAHSGDRAVRHEHGRILAEWVRATARLQSASVLAEGLQLFVGFGLAAWLLLEHLGTGEVGRVLLLIYWALKLPVLADEIALTARQYPVHRNRTLRLLEPLGASVDRDAGAVAESAETKPEPGAGVAISMAGVDVRIAGHAVLENVDLDVRPGRHVALVGMSGAGKSTLVGLLLGWHRPATGAIRVDGRALDSAALDELRAHTAWVDPAVHVWNRGLAENLQYGADRSAPLAPAIDAADLRPVLESLPLGLQTDLGENGGLVSGGEGQRVRFGRALLRRDARLVILDEPFRGLDRSKRAELLAKARSWWPGATLICITHDVGETLSFDEVVVMEAGRIVEHGVPHALGADSRSRFRRLLDVERDVRERSWSREAWSRVRLEDGRLVPVPEGEG